MKKYLLLLVTTLVILSLVVACGSESASPSSSSPQEEPAVTESPAEGEESQAPAAEKTLEEAPPESSSRSTEGSYTHPSGAFSVDAFSSTYEEFEDGTIFQGESASVLTFFEEAQTELNDESLEGVTNDLLDRMLVQSGFAESVEAYADEAETTDSGYLVYFTTWGDSGDGEGELYIVQDQQLGGAILLAADYDEVAPAWQAVVESFTLSHNAAVADAVPEDGGPEAVEASDPAAPAAAEGEYDFDSGFRPEVDGFSFYNYGNDEVVYNLTPIELRRMFGDQVCASLSGGECLLTPPAQQWMEQINGYMDGGHCEGMAVLSTLMYTDRIAPQDFGGEATFDLQLSNEALQREIAYWWTTQSTYPAALNKINQSPTEVLDTLIETFQQGRHSSETWALGIYKSDFTGGHAITPFAVKDQGNGLYHVLVYDNNFPGETRVLEIDRNRDTWQYQASTNPDVPEELYEGAAELQNIELAAIFPRLEAQDCDFCAGLGLGLNKAAGGLAALEPDYYQVWLQGPTDLLIINDLGQRVGFDQGQFVNEIDGAQTFDFKFSGIDVWEAKNEPAYRLPAGQQFEIIVDGSRLEEAADSEISMIGPGFYLAIDELYLEPGQADSIYVSTDQQRHHLTYYTDYADSPVIELGVETDQADYALLVQATELTGEQDVFDVGIDLEVGDFFINTTENTAPVTFDFAVLRLDEEGEPIFGGEGLVMAPDDVAYINYLEWVDDGSVMLVDLDHGNDGEIDETLELADSGDEFAAQE
jgi:hypothetical protein